MSNTTSASSTSILSGSSSYSNGTYGTSSSVRLTGVMSDSTADPTSVSPIASPTNLTDSTPSIEADAATGSHRNRAGLVAGLSVGAVALLLLGLLAFFCYRRRRRSSLNHLISDRSIHEADIPPPPFEESSEKASFSSTLYEKRPSWMPSQYRKEKAESYRSALPPSVYGYGVGLSPTVETTKSDSGQFIGYAYIPDVHQEAPPRVPRRSVATRSSRRTDKSGSTLYDRHAQEAFQLQSISR